MIIDSHAHYAHKLYTGEFSYLGTEDGGYCLRRGDRREMLETMESSGITLCIEPSTDLERIEDQLSLAAEYPHSIRLAMGLHPKKCGQTPWEDREKLGRYVLKNDIVAIGETGLDYHLPPQELDKPCQMQWFQYQIGLAHERQLPLILHIREADQDALAILRQNRQLLHGGVAHCFGADYETAMAYIELGFAIGIGGRLLHDDPMGQVLSDTVKRVPLTSILVETDAPYILPDIRELACSGKQRKKVRNSSLILPAVIQRIAQLRREPAEAVEQAIYQNTLRVFRLDQA